MWLHCCELIKKCFIHLAIMDKYLIKSGASQTEDKQRNKRKYKDDYFEFGFIAIETEDPQIPSRPHSV